MIKAVLLDLDNTLLGNADYVFVPAYLQCIDLYVQTTLGYNNISKALVKTVQAIPNRNRPPYLPNIDFILASLAHDTGLSLDTLSQTFASFYGEAYSQLRQCTEPIDVAPHIIQHLRELDLSVVIATNPLYPETAVYQRMAWAGLPDEPDTYALVTSANNMHFAKPNPAYFAEILARVGIEPDEAVMVGDNPLNDIAPAAAIGIHTFQVITENTAVSPSAISSGTLTDFYNAIADGWLDRLVRQPLKPGMITPQLQGNVGALHGLVSNIQPHFWHQHPDPNEWSPIQIVCHLLESEQKVQRPRLQSIQTTDNPFLVAPKAPVGAQAVPCADDGIPVVQEFAEERASTIQFLQSLQPPDWNRIARHSIFGPTTLLEMAHFTAQHDRLHINQLCETIGNCK